MDEHQEYIQRHKQETSQYERQMEALKAQLKDSQHRCATLKMKQLSSESNIEQLVHEKKDLSESVHLKDVQLADLVNVQHEKDDNAKVLQSQAEQLKQQIDKDQSCYNNLQSEKMEEEQKCHKLEFELNNVQVQKELSETTEKSNHLLNELKMNAEQLVIEKDRLSETIKSKDAIIAMLENEKLVLEDNAKLLSSQADQLKQRSDAEKVENERLQNERIDLMQKCQALNTELSEVKGQLTEAQSHILTVSDKSNNLINELKMNIEQISRERNGLLETIKIRIV